MSTFYKFILTPQGFPLLSDGADYTNDPSVYVWELSDNNGALSQNTFDYKELYDSLPNRYDIDPNNYRSLVTVSNLKWDVVTYFSSTDRDLNLNGQWSSQSHNIDIVKGDLIDPFSFTTTQNYSFDTLGATTFSYVGTASYTWNWEEAITRVRQEFYTDSNELVVFEKESSTLDVGSVCYLDDFIAGGLSFNIDLNKTYTNFYGITYSGLPTLAVSCGAEGDITTINGLSSGYPFYHLQDNSYSLGFFGTLSTIADGNEILLISGLTTSVNLNPGYLDWNLPGSAYWKASVKAISNYTGSYRWSDPLYFSFGPRIVTMSSPSYFTYNLGFDPVDPAQACGLLTPFVAYSASGTITVGTFLYADTSLSAAVPDGVYSDGTDNWVVTLGEVTNENISGDCSAYP